MRLLSSGLIILLSFLFALSACTPNVRMDIKVYSDPEQNTDDLKRFSLEQNNRENPLLGKELATMLKDRLTGKGFAYDENNPDFIVTFEFHTTSVKYYVPPATQFVSQYVPGETRTFTGVSGGSPVQVTEQSAGHYELRPQVTGGYTDTAYHNGIKIYFTQYNKTLKAKKGEIFWRGEGNAETHSSDIRLIAPFLMHEILGEYPVRTGKPGIRILKLK